MELQSLGVFVAQKCIIKYAKTCQYHIFYAKKHIFLTINLVDSKIIRYFAWENLGITGPKNISCQINTKCVTLGLYLTVRNLSQSKNVLLRFFTIHNSFILNLGLFINRNYGMLIIRHSDFSP